MSKKIIALTLPDCAGCEMLKEDTEGKIEFCELNDGGICDTIANFVELDKTPTVVEVDEKKGVFKKCTLKHDEEKGFIAKCNDKTYFLSKKRTPK